MTLSKEKLAHYAMHTDGPVKAMARELLERRGRDKQEPDGWQFLGVNGLWVSVTENGMREALKEGFEVRPLYAAPQLPQPAVPEKATPDDIEILASIRPPHGVAYQWDEDQRNAAADAWNACRAAMLQGAEPVAPVYKLPFEQWLSQQTGTIDVECGCVMTEVFYHWLRVAYEAGNSPVIQDGWIPCSERMPEEIGRYWCYVEEQNSLGKSHYQWNCSWNGDRWWVESENGGRVTHWMALPEAPQQEVK